MAKRFAAWSCLALLAAALTARLAMAGIGWWLDCGDAPERADAIVVLGGAFTRPVHGADLYRRGLAPQVWLSRIRPTEDDLVLAKAGVSRPAETELNKEILIKRGVPAKDIRLYGRDVNSTADEARALADELPSRGRTVLLVTSRYHARRARLIFRARLPGDRIIVSAPPDEGFDRRWWRSKRMTVAAAMEMCKLLNYLTGSFFGRGA